MKTIRNILSIALILGASGASFEARAGCLGFSICVPFLSFGIGLGVGGACAGPAYGWSYGYPAYGCAYGYPAYTYARPAYACNPPASYIPPAATAPAEANVAQTPVWVPSTPGAGHWVPDPEPYNYALGQTVERASVATVTPPQTVAVSKSQTRTGTSQTATVSKSAGGVPVYFVSR